MVLWVGIINKMINRYNDIITAVYYGVFVFFTCGYVYVLV